MIQLVISFWLVLAVSLLGIRASKWSAVFWGMNIFYCAGLLVLGLDSEGKFFQKSFLVSLGSSQSALLSALQFSFVLCGAQWLVRRLLPSSVLSIEGRDKRQPVVLGSIAFFACLILSIYFGRSVSYDEYVSGGASGWWSAFFLSACCLASIERGFWKAAIIFIILSLVGVYLVAATGTRFVLIAVGASVLGNLLLQGTRIRLGFRQWFAVGGLLLLSVTAYQYFDYQRVGAIRLAEQNVVEMAALVNEIPSAFVGWQVSSYFTRFIGGFLSLVASKAGVELNVVEGELAYYIARDVVRHSASYAHYPAMWWLDIKFQNIFSQVASVLFIALTNQIWPALVKKRGWVVAFFPLLALVQMLIARGAIAYTGALVFLPLLIVSGLLFFDATLRRVVRPL